MCKPNLAQNFLDGTESQAKWFWVVVQDVSHIIVTFKVLMHEKRYLIQLLTDRWKNVRATICLCNEIFKIVHLDMKDF